MNLMNLDFSLLNWDLIQGFILKGLVILFLMNSAPSSSAEPPISPMSMTA